MLKSTEELFQARMAMATTVSNETIVATMRGAKLKNDAKLKDFASIVMGVPNSGVKLDEYFRIIKPLLVEQTIEGVKQKMRINLSFQIRNFRFKFFLMCFLQLLIDSK